MAELTITETGVVAQSTAKVGSAAAGATITQGQSVYLDANGDLQLASNASALLAPAIGIALSAGASGTLVFYVSEGPMALGATLTKTMVLGTGGKVI